MAISDIGEEHLNVRLYRGPEANCIAINRLSVTRFAIRRLYLVTKLYFNEMDQGIAD